MKPQHKTTIYKNNLARFEEQHPIVRNTPWDENPQDNYLDLLIFMVVLAGIFFMFYRFGV